MISNKIIIVCLSIPQDMKRTILYQNYSYHLPCFSQATTKYKEMVIFNPLHKDILGLKLYICTDHSLCLQGSDESKGNWKQVRYTGVCLHTGGSTPDLEPSTEQMLPDMLLMVTVRHTGPLLNVKHGSTRLKGLPHFAL